jgi:hypothetical protein
MAAVLNVSTLWRPNYGFSSVCDPDEFLEVIARRKLFENPIVQRQKHDRVRFHFDNHRPVPCIVSTCSPKVRRYHIPVAGRPNYVNANAIILLVRKLLNHYEWLAV